uniref:Uncharacterized protein n=1 Tax=Oryza glaberrima TaxID=4538 RepID=I1PRX7_ORYGL
MQSVFPQMKPIGILRSLVRHLSYCTPKRMFSLKSFRRTVVHFQDSQGTSLVTVDCSTPNCLSKTTALAWVLNVTGCLMYQRSQRCSKSNHPQDFIRNKLQS